MEASSRIFFWKKFLSSFKAHFNTKKYQNIFSEISVILCMKNFNFAKFLLISTIYRRKWSCKMCFTFFQAHLSQPMMMMIVMLTNLVPRLYIPQYGFTLFPKKKREPEYNSYFIHSFHPIIKFTNTSALLLLVLPKKREDSRGFCCCCFCFCAYKYKFVFILGERTTLPFNNDVLPCREACVLSKTGFSSFPSA